MKFLKEVYVRTLKEFILFQQELLECKGCSFEEVSCKYGDGCCSEVDKGSGVASFNVVRANFSAIVFYCDGEFILDESSIDVLDSNTQLYHKSLTLEQLMDFVKYPLVPKVKYSKGSIEVHNSDFGLPHTIEFFFNVEEKKQRPEWFGGGVYTIIYRSCLFQVFATGNVVATLKDSDGSVLVTVSDYINNGDFRYKMESYINSDQEMQMLIDSGRLVFESVNTFELNVRVPGGALVYDKTRIIGSKNLSHSIIYVSSIMDQLVDEIIGLD